MKVTVLVPIVKLTLGLAPGEVVAVVVGSVVLGGVVVVVVGVVVVAGVVVVVVAAVRDVVTEGDGVVVDVEPKISKMINTTRSTASAPNKTNAHGLRYHGGGGCSGGAGGCCPYPMYSVGCSE